MTNHIAEELIENPELLETFLSNAGKIGFACLANKVKVIELNAQLTETAFSEAIATNKRLERKVTSLEEKCVQLQKICFKRLEALENEAKSRATVK